MSPWTVLGWVLVIFLGVIALGVSVAIIQGTLDGIANGIREARAVKKFNKDLEKEEKWPSEHTPD